MKSFIRYSVSLFVLCGLLVLGATPVVAQGMGIGAGFPTTDGIRFGAFSMHPAIYSALRYEDNIFFVPDNYVPENDRSIPQGIEADFVINTVPSVTFNLDWPTFRMMAGYRYYNDTYLGYDDPNDQHDLLNGNNHTVTGLIDYKAPFGLMIGASDTYMIIQTFESSTQYVDYLRGDQDHNEAIGWLGYRHGPEDNIYFLARYHNVIDKYKNFEDYDRMGHLADGQLRMKFFPRTAVVAEGGYGAYGYTNLESYDSVGWWAKGGLQGQITSVMYLTLKGGWAQSDYANGNNLATWLADGEIAFMFPTQTQLSLAYSHFARPAADTNFAISHEGRLNLTQMFWSRLAARLSGAYVNSDFSDPFARQEDLFQGDLDLTYQFVHWLFVGGGYRYERLLFDDDSERNTTTRNIGIVHIQAQF